MTNSPTETTERGSSYLRPSLPRKRRRRGKCAKHQVEQRGFITLDSGETGCSPHIVRELDGDLPRQRGAYIRNSTRWIHAKSQPLTALNFPYIDYLGRYTGSTLFKWSCDPRSYVASVVSTISQRLHRHCLRHNPYWRVKKFHDQVVKVAFYYAHSKNLYFWNRILSLTRNLERNSKVVPRVLHAFTKNTGDDKRFVYGHVCFQTKWLLFRAERPRGKPAMGGKRGLLLSRVEDNSCLLKIGGTLSDLAKAMSTMCSV